MTAADSIELIYKDQVKFLERTTLSGQVVKEAFNLDVEPISIFYITSEGNNFRNLTIYWLKAQHQPPVDIQGPFHLFMEKVKAEKAGFGSLSWMK